MDFSKAKSLKIVAAISIPILLVGCGSSSNSAMSGMDHSKAEHPSTSSGTAAKAGGTYIDMPLSEAVKNAELFDSTGKKFTLGSLNGKLLVISNFLTSCQEICPMTTANMRDIGDAISKAGLSEKVISLEISVDANRDSSNRIAAYKDLYGSNSWTLASGSESALRDIWKFFGAPAQKENFSASDLKTMPVDWQTGKPNKYDMVHADLVVIVDERGHWRWLDLGSPKISSKVPDKLKRFLSPQGLSNLTKPEEPTWTVAAVTSALSDLVGKKV